MRGKLDRPTLRLTAIVVLAASVLTLCARPTRAAESKKYLIRPNWREGERLKCRLEVEADVGWDPKKTGLSWVEVDTEFDFELKGKALRESGACTFELNGKRLKASAKGPEGKLSISADESKATIRSSKSNHSLKVDSPFTRPMTATLGPLGGFRYGTGLYPVAPYFWVGVDRLFWRILTTAPQKEVGVGDEWEVDFAVHIPDSTGEPLHIAGKAEVTGWENVGDRKCLVVKMKGKTELEDTTVTLKNGDRVHVDQGRYEVAGKALWDVKEGLLRRAEAECELRVSADEPYRSTLKGRARAKLKVDPKD